MEITSASCQGTACFAARHLIDDRWELIEGRSPRVYCLGKCYAAPASGCEKSQPVANVHCRWPVVLERIASGGALSLEAYRARGGLIALERALTEWAETLCDDPRLASVGACRICVVEVDGQSRPVAACTTPLEQVMVIRTHTPELEKCRRMLLRLLAQNYPAQAVKRDPLSPFHRLVRTYGLENDLNGKSQATLVDDSHACIHVDMSLCMSCFRCVRICHEVAGQDADNDRINEAPDAAKEDISNAARSAGIAGTGGSSEAELQDQLLKLRR